MNTEEMQTLAEFIAAHGLTMTAERADENPNMDSDGREMDHWKVRIKMGRKSMSLPFSMGIGHKGKAPDVATVLDCLAMDASSVENARDFADWADELGYDADSRKAERIYKTCIKQAEKLKALIGEDAYQALLWNTERL